MGSESSGEKCSPSERLKVKRRRRREKKCTKQQREWERERTKGGRKSIRHTSHVMHFSSPVHRISELGDWWNNSTRDTWSDAAQLAAFCVNCTRKGERWTGETEREREMHLQGVSLFYFSLLPRASQRNNVRCNDEIICTGEVEWTNVSCLGYIVSQGEYCHITIFVTFACLWVFHVSQVN